MAKTKAAYFCSECGWESPKWLGQCKACSAWGTMDEAPVDRRQTGAPSLIPKTAAIRMDQVEPENFPVRPTGVSEFDRVLGGGLVPGSVVLLAGEPGVGKSTLLLDVAARISRGALARGEGPVLYVTGEESVSQVGRRARRIGAVSSHLALAAETDIDNALWHIESSKPSMIILDSVQTLTSAEVDGGPGSVGQVKAVAGAAIQEAKRSGVPTILVGHVTKDGGIAGPRTLEHLVDVVCQFEGERTTPLRLLRSAKNRYGSTEEVGCFLLNESGIEQVVDPSVLFTSGNNREVVGSSTSVTLDGHRALMTEIQALVAEGAGGSPRRTTSGLDYSRVSMVIAVLQAHLDLDLARQDVYVSTVGGAKTVEPAADLAIALAIASAAHRKPLLRGTVALGEVGLTSEIRPCSGLDRRLSEAARLGWKRALVPVSQLPDVVAPPGMDVVGVQSVQDAARHVLGLLL